MKINPADRNIIDAYKAQNKKQEAAQKKQDNKETDRAEISTRAQEITNYRVMLKNLPEVRQDKVNELKERISSGTYEPSAEKIAQGIIRERSN